MANVPIVGASPFQTETVKHFNTFSGADIVASIGNRVFGNIQAITYAVQREIAPIYVMGSPNCVAYARGKRAITGSLVFIVFDRDALLEHMRYELQHNANYGLRMPPLQALADANDKWGPNMLGNLLRKDFAESQLSDQNLQELARQGMMTGDTLREYLAYVDQMPPFDITITFLNEFGNTAQMRIEGVQLINEGMGMSIDDVVLEKACTFVARSIRPLRTLITGSGTMGAVQSATSAPPVA